MEKENKTPNIFQKKNPKKNSKTKSTRNIPSLVLTSKIPGMGLFMHSKNKITTIESLTKKKKENFKISQKNFKKSKNRLLSGKSNFSKKTESLNSQIYAKVENELIKILEEKVKFLQIKLEEKTAEKKENFFQKNLILENLLEIKEVI